MVGIGQRLYLIKAERCLVYRPNHNSPRRPLHEATSHTQRRILYEHHGYEQVRAALELALLPS